MYKIIDKEIRLTRGDIACINVTGKMTGDIKYGFQTGEVVELKVMKKGDCSTVVLNKRVIVDEPTELVKINLTSEETKIGDIINKPVIYWYEITLNPDTNSQTIIGYDDVTGAKIFKLFPEGSDINE